MIICCLLVNVRSYHRIGHYSHRLAVDWAQSTSVTNLEALSCSLTVNGTHTLLGGKSTVS